jgi:hypothetical protein
MKLIRDDIVFNVALLNITLMMIKKIERIVNLNFICYI